MKKELNLQKCIVYKYYYILFISFIFFYFIIYSFIIYSFILSLLYIIILSIFSLFLDIDYIETSALSGINLEYAFHFMTNSKFYVVL